MRTETKFARAALAVAEDGTFAGYASLFGKADLGRDMVMPGAFAASLRTRGAGGVKMLYQHDPNQPIGVWEEIREDGRGLFVKGRLTTGVARAREVLSLMRAGALDGLSIGYRTVRGRTDRKTGIRQLIEIDLWEISVVTFPMLPEARVEAVKGTTALLNAAIVAEAVTWVGTPYRHQASLKGIGCDCLGLVRGVWRVVYGDEPEAAPAYTPDWAEARGRETLAEAAARHMLAVPPDAAEAGDVLLFRWRENLPSKHAGILVEPARFVHAHQGAAVAFAALTPWWRRRVAFVFRFPGVGCRRGVRMALPRRPETI